MKVVSFLASGRGSNFQTVAESIINKEINAKLGVLITSNKTCQALDIAAKLGIAVLGLSWKEEGGIDNFEKKAIIELNKYGTDLIVCAGYMKILSPAFIKIFPNKIINIHPALLPSFPGLDAQKQALDYGVKVSGCTVHFVDDGVDSGPIIIQKIVPVKDNDSAETLSRRILKEEHSILKQAVRLFCEDSLIIRGRNVTIQNS